MPPDSLSKTTTGRLAVELVVGVYPNLAHERRDGSIDQFLKKLADQGQFLKKLADRGGKDYDGLADSSYETGT